MSHVQEDHDEAFLPFVGIIIAELTSATVVKRAPRMPSIVDGFCRLPSPASVVDSVVPDVCSLVLEAAGALLVGKREDAQNGSMLATIPGGRAGVGPAEPWPKFDATVLPLHIGPSDSPVQ